jgi:ATPase subunit of ABC transporter with duplicated ATPase domains
MLEVNQLTIEFGDRALFRDVSMILYPGHRYGLVGANGSGKSTLLKALMGEITQFSGQVNWPGRVKLGILKQDHFRYEHETILNTVIMGRPELWEAFQVQDQLIRKDDLTLEETSAFSDAEEVIQREDGYTAEADAAKLLDGLGIPTELHANNLSTLSGGYKLRVLLAQLLFSRPDALLLDEPTNHLDIFSIRWLEQSLRDFPGLLVVVSHDRDFLNATATDILDVDYGTVRAYKGNYNDFLAAKALEVDQKEREQANQEKRREELETFINRFKAKASKASSAQSRVKMLEKMEVIEIAETSRRYPHFRFEPNAQSGRVTLKVDEVSKRFEDKQVLNNVSFEINRGDKVALIGPNGIGKSTLLKIITGHLAPDQGAVTLGHEAHLGYFPQDYREEMQKDMTLLEWLGQFDAMAAHGVLRGKLGQVLFSGDDVHHRVSTLSGGEATRLLFARLMLIPNNVLVLDEPTNHLDMEAIDMLTEALVAYKGTVLVVSHNRYFVSQIATRVLELRAEGAYDFMGTYSEYLEKQGTDHLSRDVDLRNRNAFQEQLKESRAEKEAAKPVVKLSYDERKQLQRNKQKLERRITQLEAQTAQEEADLATQEEAIAAAYASGDEAAQQKALSAKEAITKRQEIALAEWEQIERELTEIKRQLG